MSDSKGRDAATADAVTGAPAAIVQFQKKQEAKFLCSACGADRACDCNAPAVEKLAEKLEQDRQRAARYKDKKRKQKQQSGHVTGADRAEARCAAKWKAFTQEERSAAIAEGWMGDACTMAWQEDLHDQACLLLEQMTHANRQRFLAYLIKNAHGSLAA